MTFVKLNNQPVARNYNGSFGSLFNELESTFNQLMQTPASASIPANIVENADGYHLELMAPGRAKDGFKLDVEKDLLTVSYEAPASAVAEGVKQIRKEFGNGSFKRSFHLNETIEIEGIQAKYEDGLLKVLLPKKQEAKPVARQIAVQ